jgi:predicted SnoaL-like aldol condensation-catalyzing enzyme
MTTERKERICALLKGIETGDPTSVAVVNPDKYIQHNPQTHEGGEGLAVLFKRLSKGEPRVNIVRIFADGEFVFGHTEYDFSSRRIGFEVFRFEGDLAVEHWDNIQSRMGPNPSGRSMVDGSTEATDRDRTESNRQMVRSFVEEVLIDGSTEKMASYVEGESYIEHNPRLEDGRAALEAALSVSDPSQGRVIRYDRNHRILAEGNFVLSVCEGAADGVHTSFYDLFRVAGGKIVEHWDTAEAIPPRSKWKNDNGKF